MAHMWNSENDNDKPKKPRVSLWAALIALLGTLSAFLAGVDWNVLLSQEGAAVAGATVGFAGALVVLVRAVQAWLEKRRV